MGYDYTNSDELCHYGRKGMKWGQNIFGKVKSGARKAGRKVADTVKAKRAEKRAERIRKSPISKLTDAELKERIERLKLEKSAADLIRASSGVDGKTISAGKSFMGKFASEAIGSAAVSAGKTVFTNLFTKGLSKALGVDVDDGISDLKKVADKLDLKKKIKEAEDYLNGKTDRGGNPIKKDKYEQLREDAAKAELEGKIAEAGSKKLKYKKDAEARKQELENRRAERQQKETEEFLDELGLKNKTMREIQEDPYDPRWVLF